MSTLIPVVGYAQVDSTALDSLRVPAPTDSLAQASPDSLNFFASDSLITETFEPSFKIQPWDYHAPLGAELVSTDSTLRWQLVPGWIYKRNRDPGAITFRMGTIGRTNSMQFYAHEPKYLQLYWEGIRLDDPVSGIVNWNLMPHHKIEMLYAEDLGVIHKTHFHLREYYLTKPLTRLNYNESNFETRSLEFMVSHNFSRKTNVELSYWDRRDGGAYSNSGIMGTQIYGRVTHQLDQRQQFKLSFLSNSYSNGLPFGYSMFDMKKFNFNHYTARANKSSATADRGSSILALNYYRRPANTDKGTGNLRAGIFMNTTNRKVIYTADTTSYRVRAYGLHLHKWTQLGPLAAEGGLSYQYHSNKSDSSSSLKTGNWGLLKGDVSLSFQPLSFLKVNTYGNYRSRGDGYSDYIIGAKVTIPIADRLELSGGLSTGTRMPTPQQLYWQSKDFAGDPGLSKERIQAMSAQLELTPFVGTTVGIRGQVKQIEDGIMVGFDSTFTNMNAYSSLGAAAYINYEGSLFELSASATMQQFGHFLTSQTNPIPMDDTRRLWFKGSAYIKGYLFNQATYVKAGLSGMIAPQPYPAAHYYPVLDYWQTFNGDDAYIPSFSRLDLDISARIRTIVVVLRWENILDGLVQQGYFETPTYPMTSRRFIFGIRVLFRN